MSTFFYWALLLFSSCISHVFATTSCAEPGRRACQHLKHEFGHVLFMRHDKPYAELRTKNWSQTAWRAPACIFRPTNARQIGAIIPFLVRSGTQFAIRSGGHSPSPSAANIDNGLLIDLSGLNGFDYNASSQVAVIGPGLTWGEVYANLDPFGVTVVGGRVLDVGVGGLVLGGGLSYLSDLHGLACDNVISYEVVLANGSIVDANQYAHKELYWALKGGTNNFGIVTSFTVATYPIGLVWAGIKTYSLEGLPALFDAMYEYQTAPFKDQYANLMLQGLFTNQTATILLSLVYLKPVESPAAFNPFYGIKPVSDTTKMTNFSDFMGGQGPATFPPRVYFRTTTFQPDRSLYSSLTELLALSNATKALSSLADGAVAFGLQPISTGLIQAGRNRGTNALGLSLVNQTWFVIDSGARLQGDEDLMRELTHDILEPIVARSKASGKSLPYIFMNDAGWDQDVLASYGKENVARLQNVRNEYDPEQVFQELVPGGFKLP